ncbi:sigma-54-dependent Fis family transcriptional regulator [Pseudomonas sp. MYb185]|uniref:sigma-54-dependent Fis family transcriptional regulator n=1 Tax=Pseudomonas sp. MYb185 TaxID=1848729 RepID=UPI000CFCBBB2|nr:sigma-54-dependent Fis family transcriptional regulator [Pseudomonas sp. MYb185]PRB81403.1 sigma-54-dependent Fis family transcriptional regulator [Pseudomonas sp. MYb185]
MSPSSDSKNSRPHSLKDVITDLRFPNMQDLAEHLYFNPEKGMIWLGDKRMLMLHAEAFGSLRQELLETLGVEQTRGLLTRIGYLSGTRDAELAIKTRQNGSQLDILAAGAQLRSLCGIIEVEPVRIEVDQHKGYLYGEFTWKHSIESDLHLATLGQSHDPVCWMETGYSSGFLTRLMGKRILVRESECVARGDDVCRAVARPVEDWDDADDDLQYFQPRLSGQRRRPAPARSEFAGMQPGKAPFGLAFKQQDVVELDRPVGSSAAYHAVLHKILRVASTNATVLLLGESGVGKTMFAHEVHANSRRADTPFIEINCAAIPDTLIESELFGVQRGAYSGATEARAGRFEIADGGTIFLDEIGTLSMTAQGKLLRVLQSGELERLGSTKTLKIDVRVIAATNEDLSEAVKQGRFRSDLFYRLNVFPVTIAPLRERKDDLPLLLERFVNQLCQQHGRRLAGITPRALQRILDYPWPGNIREFENVIERAVILADDGETIDLRHLSGLEDNQREHQRGTVSWDQAPGIGIRLPEPSATPAGAAEASASGPSLDHTALRLLQQQPLNLNDIEDAFVRAAMHLAQQNITRAAALLGLTRAQMDYRLKKMANSDG